MLGLYLGDGSISDVARTARLRITLDSAYPQVVEECRSAIAAVMPDRRVNVAPRKLSRCVDVGCYSKLWPTLFPQHAPGPKHLRSITLEPWQRDLVVRCPREFIRGLYHSDGCYVTNRINSGNGTTYAYDRYFFSNESAEIRQLFSWACALVGVSSRQSNRKTISVARREAVAMLNGFLGAKR